MGIENIQALINESHFESNDETDVPAALERKTFDGSGFDAPEGANSEDELPPSENLQEEE